MLTGLFLTLSITLYTLTGFAMKYERFFPKQQQTTRTAVEFEFSPTELRDEHALATLAERARAELSLRGRVRTATDSDGTVRLSFDRPAVLQKLALDPRSGAAELEVTERNLQQLANRLHQIDGYEGGTAYAAWALLLDATAVAMLIFAISGVTMWWIAHRDRLGAWLLVASTLYTATGIAYLLLAR
jgi:hypothetical protein